MKINAVEAFKTALNVEIIGEKFYLEVAKKTENQEAKEIFLNLAADEKEHQEDFEKIIKNIRGMEKEIEIYSDSEEIDGYLNAVMSTNVFKSIPSIDTVVANTKSDVDALKIGLEAEKSSILYYSGLLEMFTDKKVHEIFSKVLREERKHLKELVDVLEEKIEQEGS